MSESSLAPHRAIEDMIHVIRGQRVMLDADLATLYGVQTKALNQAVSRNLDRFPDDFMFVLTRQEFAILKSQTVTSSWGGRRTPPRAFTEQGVAMLSSVLRSKRAVQVNIEIVRAFVRLRKMLATHEDLARKLAEFEKTLVKHDSQFAAVFEAIRSLMAEPAPERRRIGFTQTEGD